MITIKMNSPKNPAEVRALSKATKLMKGVEQRAQKLTALDNSKQDFNPAEGSIAVDGVSLSEKRTQYTGILEVVDGDVSSMNLEKDFTAEIEVDHMMWGKYRATTSSTFEEQGQNSHYHIKDEVKGLLVRDYDIVVNHEEQTLTFDQSSKNYGWVRGTRGLSLSRR